MRAVIQRVTSASVSVDGKIVGAIEKGFLVLLGVGGGDSEEDSLILAKKISQMRVFEDNDGKMNRSLADIDGKILAISNFTLLADCRRGNRPDFFGAEKPERASFLYEKFIDDLDSLTGKITERGIFGADMKLSLVNDGPVTIVLNSEELKKSRR